MTYTIDVKPRVGTLLHVWKRKSPVLHANVMRKMPMIAMNPHRYKNLHSPLQHLKRVHVGGSFVLTFSVDEENRTVTLEDLDHHDRIYKR